MLAHWAEVLNIDTNVIQPLTLESIANGTSVNQALQELRCNNTANGRLVTEAFLRALKSNPSLCKLGYPVTDAYFRGEIDKQLTRNNDAARKRRLEEKRRREAGEVAESQPEPKGYPAKTERPKPAQPAPEPVKEVVKEVVKEEPKPEIVVDKPTDSPEPATKPEEPAEKETPVVPIVPETSPEPATTSETSIPEEKRVEAEEMSGKCSPEEAPSSLKEPKETKTITDLDDESMTTDIPGTIESFLGEEPTTSVHSSDVTSIRPTRNLSASVLRRLLPREICVAWRVGPKYCLLPRICISAWTSKLQYHCL